MSEVTVTQADRDAAAELMLRFSRSERIAEVRAGEADDIAFVQAFARHRANTAPDLGELAGLVERVDGITENIQMAAERLSIEAQLRSTGTPGEEDRLRAKMGSIAADLFRLGMTPSMEAALAIGALSAERERMRVALDDLQQAEAEYRQMHDRHGDGAMAAGRAWDRMRHAGDRARQALATQELRK